MTAKSMEFIAPLVVAIEIDGREMSITPLVLRELPRFLELALPAFSALPHADESFFDRMEAGQLSADEMSSLITALAVSGGELIELLALCTRQPTEWLGGLLIDRAAELAAVSFQVNMDFFRRAGPLLLAMAARFKASGTATAAATEAAAQPTPSATRTVSPSS